MGRIAAAVVDIAAPAARCSAEGQLAAAGSSAGYRSVQIRPRKTEWERKKKLHPTDIKIKRKKKKKRKKSMI